MLSSGTACGSLYRSEDQLEVRCSNDSSVLNHKAMTKLRGTGAL
jgi:hypothetical protein